jgi:hypothetical protein
VFELKKELGKINEELKNFKPRSMEKQETNESQDENRDKGGCFTPLPLEEQQAIDNHFLRIKKEKIEAMIEGKNKRGCKCWG